MMVTIKLILLAIIFVVTSGAVFTETFKKNRLLVVLAAIVAIVSSYYLFEGIYKDIIQEIKNDTKTVEKPPPAKTEVTKPMAQKTEVKKETRYPFEPEMVKISKGSFIMGSDDGYKNEKPPHKVTIHYDFEIGKYEVTFEEYDYFCEETGRKKLDDAGWGRGKRPVINVSWRDAKAYAKWLSEKTGKEYRLPTEAEWEYSARAGTKTKWSFGDNEKELEKYAWYTKNLSSSTHLVGEKDPNPWGLYDMYGNVWEWCEDWYVENYKNTPRDDSANERGEKIYKVLRGGSWYSIADYTRSAFRFRLNPDIRGYVTGFRLLRTLPS